MKKSIIFMAICCLSTCIFAGKKGGNGKIRWVGLQSDTRRRESTAKLQAKIRQRGGTPSTEKSTVATLANGHMAQLQGLPQGTKWVNQMKEDAQAVITTAQILYPNRNNQS